MLRSRSGRALGAFAPLALSLFSCGGKAAPPASVPRGSESAPVATESPVTPAKSDVPLAPLLQGMGDFHWAISTKVPQAQRFFDQGMVLSYGFNHSEAKRSFLEAARLDPSCAMCYWGASLVLGPNINAEMKKEVASEAVKLAAKARELSSGASELEKDLIATLATRYVDPAPADRKPLDEAYAQAMKQLSVKYANNVDVITLFAEALMDLHPWNYWEKINGPAQPWTPEILALLESAMKQAPMHPGANHLYIHAVEFAKDVERAVPAAERLSKIAPGAGHLMHMPSHIFIRVGRYHDASLANEAGIKADDGYETQCRMQGIYPTLYKPHNWQFLWFATTFEGRSQRSLEAARELKKRVPEGTLLDHCMAPLSQLFDVVPLYALVRFGKWDEILQEPKPIEKLVYANAAWHYARGLAYLGKNDVANAEKEHALLQTALAPQELANKSPWDVNSKKNILAVGAGILDGLIAAAKKDYKTAITKLEAAVSLEVAMSYAEPPDWLYPVRHSLGKVYLDAKKPKEAERVYRADLEIYPDNGFSLFGLAQALRAQGKKKEAAAVEARFAEQWKNADVKLTSSRY